MRCRIYRASFFFDIGQALYLYIVQCLQRPNVNEVEERPGLGRRVVVQLYNRPPAHPHPPGRPQGGTLAERPADGGSDGGPKTDRLGNSLSGFRDLSNRAVQYGEIYIYQQSLSAAQASAVFFCGDFILLH